MKKLGYILLTLAATASLSSCIKDDFLTVLPSGVITEDILQSADGVDMLINAAYGGLGFYGSRNAGSMSSPATNWVYGEVRADNAYKGGGTTSDQSPVHEIEIFTNNATSGNLNTLWTNLYTAVYRANSALRVLNNCTVEDVPNVEILKAEMRFVRAHSFFSLSRIFNQIVWIDDTIDPNDYDHIPNNEFTRDEILGKVAAEFEAAEKVLPATQKDAGRATKYAAAAYAAKAYLYKAYVQDEKTHAVTSINTADLNKVVTYCDEVINSGKYKLFEDWQWLDMLEHENGEEFIFEVQYSFNDGSSGAGRTNANNLLNFPQGPYSGDGFFLPSQDLVNSFQTDENGLPYLDGWFQDHDYDLLEVDGDVVKNTHIDSNVDPRLDFIVGRANVTWKTYTVTPCLASWMRSRNIYGDHTNKRFILSPESPNIYKAWPWSASGLNWSLLRYANVLLWKAEALIELGRQDEARPLINQVRARAKNSPWVKAWTDLSVVPFAPNFDGYAAKYKVEEYPAAGWTQSYAREAVRFETRLETAMEGERFFDLVRWGIAAETMTNFFNAEKDLRAYYTNASFKKGTNEYFPIPTNQNKLAYNLYSQNPGYEF